MRLRRLRTFEVLVVTLSPHLLRVVSLTEAFLYFQQDFVISPTQDAL